MEQASPKAVLEIESAAPRSASAQLHVLQLVLRGQRLSFCEPPQQLPFAAPSSICLRKVSVLSSTGYTIDFTLLFARQLRGV